ncbi:hypothetical protein [Succinatimonas hippei]|nr:hypothetical protein [Succinatimonas hippei]
MDTLIIAVIVILVMIPCFLGLRRIFGTFTGKSSTCGCSGNECHCNDKKQ